MFRDIAKHSQQIQHNILGNLSYGYHERIHLAGVIGALKYEFDSPHSNTVHTEQESSAGNPYAGGNLAALRDFRIQQEKQCKHLPARRAR